MFVFSVYSHVSKLKVVPHVTFTVSPVLTNHNLDLFNFQSNTESSDSNSNTAMMIDDLTQVITTVISDSSEREPDLQTSPPSICEGIR